MLTMGCDLHTRYQVVALVDTETGEMVTHWLENSSGEAAALHTGLPSRASWSRPCGCADSGACEAKFLAPHRRERGVPFLVTKLSPYYDR